jgi:hypothetical protein
LRTGVQEIVPFAPVLIDPPAAPDVHVRRGRTRGSGRRGTTPLREALRAAAGGADGAGRPGLRALLLEMAGDVWFVLGMEPSAADGEAVITRAVLSAHCRHALRWLAAVDQALACVQWNVAGGDWPRADRVPLLRRRWRLRDQPMAVCDEVGRVSAEVDAGRPTGGPAGGTPGTTPPDPPGAPAPPARS